MRCLSSLPKLGKSRLAALVRAPAFRRNHLRARLPMAYPRAPSTNHQRMETSNEDNEDAGESCVICLSSITERAITSCNHTLFDFICLVSWLQERSSCPLCEKSQKSSKSLSLITLQVKQR
jgi:hypothetical protein